MAFATRHHQITTVAHMAGRKTCGIQRQRQDVAAHDVRGRNRPQQEDHAFSNLLPEGDRLSNQRAVRRFRNRRQRVGVFFVEFVPQAARERQAGGPLAFDFVVQIRNGVRPADAEKILQHAERAVFVTRAIVVAVVRHRADNPHAAVFNPLANPFAKPFIFQRRYERREQNFVSAEILRGFQKIRPQTAMQDRLIIVLDDAALEAKALNNALRVDEIRRMRQIMESYRRCDFCSIQEVTCSRIVSCDSLHFVVNMHRPSTGVQHGAMHEFMAAPMCAP